MLELSENQRGRKSNIYFINYFLILQHNSIIFLNYNQIAKMTQIFNTLSLLFAQLKHRTIRHIAYDDNIIKTIVSTRKKYTTRGCGRTRNVENTDFGRYRQYGLWEKNYQKTIASKSRKRFNRFLFSLQYRCDGHDSTDAMTKPAVWLIFFSAKTF